VSNDDVYAAGLLNRALDPATQPPAIKAFLQAERDLLASVVAPGARVIDIGCGTGRHLIELADRIGFGLGIDYEHSYVVQAARHRSGGHIHFITADATAVPAAAEFDFAMCLTNTWGTMRDQTGVLREMRRVAPRAGTRLLSVYSHASVPARRNWYGRLGHPVLEETDDYLLTDGDFRSEHFTEARLRALVGDCVIRPLADIAYVVTF